VTPGAVADRASRLATVVARLGDEDWREDVERLAGAPAKAEGEGPTPTYGDVARVGTAVVAALGAEGRWDEAVVQSRHLLTFFGRTGFRLGPIAIQAFDGLLAASLARDIDELGDFVELVQEMFP
jgi:hypothetical protein